MWRVLAVGAVVAGGAHVVSLPWISRMVSGSQENVSPDIVATPIEIVVEEEVVQQTPEPEPEPPEENPEPAASAERPSAAPLATNAEPVPTSEVASADTVAVSPSIATENGEVDGQGAVGTSSAIGLEPGTGEPTESGDRINLPDIAASIESAPPARPREAVQTIARRAPTSRLISCNPCSIPDYPESARREEIEGQPTINVVFDGNGRVIDAVVETSSGNAAFDRAALEEAKRNWRFRDEQGLGGQVSVDVTYVIDDSDQHEEARQAGEVRAVNLPIGQQTRSVAPDQPSSYSNSTATRSTETINPRNTSLDSSSPNSTEPAITHSAPTESSEANQSPESNASLSSPQEIEFENQPPQPSEESASQPMSNSQAPIEIPPAPSAPASPAPVSPAPAAPEPIVPVPVSAAEPTPLLSPTPQSPNPQSPTSPPDILPSPDSE